MILIVETYTYYTSLLHSPADTFLLNLLISIEFSNADVMFSWLLQVQNSYFLVSLVDNDYIQGDVFAVFADFWMSYFVNSSIS